MSSTYFFVENLAPLTWAFNIWPRLLRRRVGNGPRVACCYVFDGSSLTLLLAQVSAWFTGVPVQKLDFRIADMQNENSESIRWRILYGDMIRVQHMASANPSFQQFLGAVDHSGRIPHFLEKRLVAASFLSRGDLWRAVNLVRICQWIIRKIEADTGNKSDAETETQPWLFLEHLPWLDSIDEFASECQVSIVPIRPSLNLASRWRQIVPSWALARLRRLRYSRVLRSTEDQTIDSIPVAESRELQQVSASNESRTRPRVAFDYYGQGNLDNPERHSDLFFWQQSSLVGSNLLCLLPFPGFPLNVQSWTEMKNHNIEALRTHPGAASVPDIPLFSPGKAATITHINIAKSAERKWLNRGLAEYQKLFSFWSDLANQKNIKIYLTWYKYSADHFAISDALEATGGITGIYQRAIEINPSPENTIDSDIVFGFSQKIANVERNSHSRIRYHVTTGYLGDHRFPLVRENAQKIRNQLLSHGAKRILAYLDENSAEDPRWLPGHHLPQKNYAFLLEKVLTEPWLGLVIKPKVPKTLRRRLGSVTELLRKAEATGRCYVHEAQDNSPVQGWSPPVEAALASDLTIHGDLAAVTAGAESALAGVPTLLYDPEGCPTSPFYDLGGAKIAFTDWESLWSACLQHWSEPSATPGFGDWTPILDDLDPFRDGRAAERMGNYVDWLLDGFRAGLDRDSVMANAAERYCAAWGEDKIAQVNWKETPGRLSDNTPRLLANDQYASAIRLLE